MQNETAATGTGGHDSRTWADGILVILFSVGIGLPLLGYLVNGENFAHGKSSAPAAANRGRNALPTWDGTLPSLMTVPTRFERNFNDHFGYREQLVGLCGKTKVFGLGDSSNGMVILGHNDWLFFVWEENGHSARSPTPFQPTDLQKWRTVLEARSSWLAERHCQYLFVVAPEKQSIYPQYLPDWLPAQPCQHTRTIQLLDCLRGGALTGNILDLGDSLREAASQERVYHKTDTHWNGRGAFAAYSAIMHNLSARFPGMEPLPPARIRRTTNVTPGLDLARMLGVSRHLPEEKLDVAVVDPCAREVNENVEIDDNRRLESFTAAVYENSDYKLPKAIVIGDSFSHSMIPFLAEHFSRLVYLPEHVLDPKVIERERPDVIIHEIVERKLFTVPPVDPVCEPDYARVPRMAGNAKQTR